MACRRSQVRSLSGPKFKSSAKAGLFNFRTSKGVLWAGAISLRNGARSQVGSSSGPPFITRLFGGFSSILRHTHKIQKNLFVFCCCSGQQFATFGQFCVALPLTCHSGTPIRATSPANLPQIWQIKAINCCVGAVTSGFFHIILICLTHIPTVRTCQTILRGTPRMHRGNYLIFCVRCRVCKRAAQRAF